MVTAECYSGGCWFCSEPCFGGCEFGCCCCGRVFNTGPCCGGWSDCGVATTGSSPLFGCGWRYSGGVNSVLGCTGVLGSTTIRLLRVRNAGAAPLRRRDSACAAKLDSTNAVLCSATCPTGCPSTSGRVETTIFALARLALRA